MNFNLALICTDGRFADARALCASWSSPHPQSGRSHQASDSGALGARLQYLLVQRYQPGASTLSPAWRDPRCPEDGQDF